MTSMDLENARVFAETILQMCIMAHEDLRGLKAAIKQ